MEKPYRPANNIVSWIVGLLYASVICDTLIILTEASIVSLYPGFYDPMAAMQPGEEALGYATLGVGLLVLLVSIPTIVMFCVWMFRVSKNARALGAREMRFDAGWAVASFFIPILNLFRPYQAVKEIELASTPDAGPLDWQRRKPSGIVSTWWAFWIIGGIINYIASNMGNSPDPDTVSLSAYPSILGSLLSIFAAFCAIRVIKHITLLQQTKVQLQPDAVQRTCLGCGYDIRGTPGTHCPECGTPIPGRDTYQDQHTAPDPTEPWHNA